MKYFKSFEPLMHEHLKMIKTRGANLLRNLCLQDYENEKSIKDYALLKRNRTLVSAMLWIENLKN